MRWSNRSHSGNMGNTPTRSRPKWRSPWELFIDKFWSVKCGPARFQNVWGGSLALFQYVQKCTSSRRHLRGQLLYRGKMASHKSDINFDLIIWGPDLGWISWTNPDISKHAWSRVHTALSVHGPRAYMDRRHCSAAPARCRWQWAPACKKI